MKRGYVLAVLFVCSTVGYGQVKDTSIKRMLHDLHEEVMKNSMWVKDTLSMQMFAIKFVLNPDGDFIRMAFSDSTDIPTLRRITGMFKSDFNWKEIYTATEATDTLTIIVPFYHRKLKNTSIEPVVWNNSTVPDFFMRAMNFSPAVRSRTGQTIILEAQVGTHYEGCRFGR